MAFTFGAALMLVAVFIHGYDPKFFTKVRNFRTMDNVEALCVVMFCAGFFMTVVSLADAAIHHLL